MVTRSALPQNYIHNAGIVFDDFDDVSNAVWQKSVGATLTAETVITKSTQSAKLMVGVEQAYGSCFHLITPEQARLLSTHELWLFCPYYAGFSGSSMPIKTFRISLWVDTTHYMQVDVGGSNGLHYGWNHIYVPREAWAVTGDTTWDSAFSRYYIRIDCAVGAQAYVYLDTIRYGVDRPGNILLTFDDGNTSVYDSAFPVMESLGVRGTAYVCTGNIGGGDPNLSWAELDELYAAGWAIGNHRETHTNHMLGSSLEDIIETYQVAQNALYDRGYLRSYKHVAYNWGEYDANHLQAMSDLGVLTARTTAGSGTIASGCQPAPAGDNLLLKCYSADSVTEANMEITLNATRGNTSIFLIHTVDGNYWDSARLTRFIQSAQAKGLRFLTIDEWYNGLTNPRYRSLPVGRA